MRRLHRSVLAATAAALLSTAPLGAALADPPPWAAAHGWRDKHEHRHRHRDRDRRDVHVYHHYDRAPGPAYYREPVIVSRGTSYGCDRSLLTGNKTLMSQILGGAGGAVAGAQFGKGTGKLAATAGGALLGFLIGTEVGQSLDAADAACAHESLEYAETGQPVVWRNPDAGAQYTMVPTRTYENSGTYCREYTTRVQVGGRTQQGYGTACRQPDGSWRMVN